MEEKKLVPRRRLRNYYEEWVEKEFSNLGIFGRTYSFSRSKEGRGIFHHIHYGDIHTKDYGVINKKSILPTIKEEGDFELLKQEDIVIADASEDYKDLGKATVIGEIANWKVIAGLHTFKFTPNNDLCSLYYLYYSQSKVFKKFSYKTGTGISVFGISKDNIGKMKLYIPTFQEQQKIGKFFKVLDERIANQERKIAKIKALKSAYLTEMFPQKGETIPKRRFRGFEVEWKKDTFEKLLKTHSFNPYLAQPKLSGKYEVIQQGNVPIIGYSNIPAFKKYRNVVLFGDHTLSLFRPTKPFLIATDGVKILEIEGVSNSFLFVLLTKYLPKSEGYKRHFSILKNQFCLMPKNVEEQQKIGAFFKNLDDQLEMEEKRLEKLKKMKEAYLEEMFV